MTVRSNYEVAVVAVGPAKASTLAMAELAKQESINASGCDVGLIGTITTRASAISSTQSVVCIATAMMPRVQFSISTTFAPSSVKTTWS